MQTLSVDQLVGQTIGSYRVERLQGRGRLNAVYQAQHITTRRVDALTLYLTPSRLSAEAQAHFLARFQKEAGALISLQHPHILPVYEQGEIAGCPYLVTPYMMHGSLADELKQYERFAHHEIMPLLEQLVAGLSYAHKRGFVHGTLRPSNIVMNADGSWQVAGFGLMHMLQLSGIELEEEVARTPYAHLLSVAGTFLAAPGYVAPEVVQGQAIDIRSDVYALGCILYELLSGQPPFTGSDALAVAKKHLSEHIPLLHTVCSDVPIALAAIVNQALERDPVRRFQSVQELGEAFTQASHGAYSVAKRGIAAPRQRPQENLRDSGNKWQLLPPIVTGKLPAISPPEPEKPVGSEPTLPGVAVSPAALAAPTLLPQATTENGPEQTSARSQGRKKEPSATRTLQPRPAPQATIDARAPQPPSRSVQVPQATRDARAPQPPSRSVQVPQEREREQAAMFPVSEIRSGEALNDLVKEYAWWSQPGAMPPIEREPAKKTAAQANPPQEREQLRQADPAPLNWTAEPVLPKSVSSQPRISRGRTRPNRRRVIALLATGGAVVAGTAVALNFNKIPRLLHLGTIPATVQTNNPPQKVTQQQGKPTPTQPPKKNGNVIGNNHLAQNMAMAFQNPKDQKESLLIHLPDSDTFTAFERACTHVGVSVNYDPDLQVIVCPAHDSMFDPATGAVLQGPATRPLPQVAIQVNNDGTISAI